MTEPDPADIPDSIPDSEQQPFVRQALQIVRNMWPESKPIVTYEPPRYWGIYLFPHKPDEWVPSDEEYERVGVISDELFRLLPDRMRGGRLYLGFY